MERFVVTANMAIEVRQAEVEVAELAGSDTGGKTIWFKDRDGIKMKDNAPAGSHDLIPHQHRSF